MAVEVEGGSRWPERDWHPDGMMAWVQLQGNVVQAFSYRDTSSYFNMTDTLQELLMPFTVTLYWQVTKDEMICCCQNISIFTGVHSILWNQCQCHCHCNDFSVLFQTPECGYKRKKRKASNQKLTLEIKEASMTSSLWTLRLCGCFASFTVTLRNTSLNVVALSTHNMKLHAEVTLWSFHCSWLTQIVDAQSH